MQKLKMVSLCLMLVLGAWILHPAAAQADSGNGIRIDGGTVAQGTVTVVGAAHHPSFRKWQLDLLVDGDPAQANFVKVAEQPQTQEGVLAQLDTTLYPNGSHQIRLRVVYGNLNYDEYFTTVTILNGTTPAETQTTAVEVAPTLSQPEAPAAVAPANGVQLEAGSQAGMIAIKGVANHPSFRKWQLDLLIDGDAEQAMFLAMGKAPISTAGLFTSLDTSVFPDGKHQIRLRVVHSNLNYDEYFTPITFANGNATMTEGVKISPESTAPISTGFDLSAAPADGTRWIEVDLSDQTLTAWQGDVAVLHASVSTGRAATPTVKGRYYINTKLPAQRMIGPGYNLPNVPSVMYFYSGYAIHGAYWHNNFGQVMSHGCVNMKLDEAAALYAWASVGTEIYVHD